MQLKAASPEKYIESLPDEEKYVISELRKEILNNLPKGFSEVMSYGMIGYVVPHSLYPVGYHCDPKQPLPFINLASQKNHVALYHMGVAADEELRSWFISEYAKIAKSKLDMGKGCIRFKKIDQIPFKLIGELVSKMDAEKWIEVYETNFKDSRKRKEEV